MYIDVMHKVQIGIIHELPCASVGSKLCAANLWIVHALTQTILAMVMSMLNE